MQKKREKKHVSGAGALMKWKTYRPSGKRHDKWHFMLPKTEVLKALLVEE